MKVLKGRRGDLLLANGHHSVEDTGAEDQTTAENAAQTWIEHNWWQCNSVTNTIKYQPINIYMYIF